MEHFLIGLGKWVIWLLVWSTAYLTIRYYPEESSGLWAIFVCVIYKIWIDNKIPNKRK